MCYWDCITDPLSDHPDMLTSINNLALTYWAQGRMGEAAAHSVYLFDLGYFWYIMIWVEEYWC